MTSGAHFSTLFLKKILLLLKKWRNKRVSYLVDNQNAVTLHFILIDRP